VKIEMQRRAILALAIGLCSSAVFATETKEPAPERLIHAKRSIPSTILGAPYALVSLTAWPLKQFVFFMEDVNLPARLTDIVTFPVRVFREDEEP
jgi:hypothetical protein